MTFFYSMHLIKWWSLYFLWALSLTDLLTAILVEDSSDLNNIYVAERPYRQNDKFSSAEYPYVRMSGNTLPLYHDYRLKNVRCSARLEMALEQIRRRQTAKQQRSLDMNGFSLHQQLRSAPYDMYVTDMRVRLPQSSSWVRVDKCRFNPKNFSLETSLLFNDLTISGRVSLFDDGHHQLTNQREPLQPRFNEDACSMILRLRRAGIGFRTEPIRRERGQFNVKTDSHFLEPGFISVYAYGCEPRLKQHRRSFSSDPVDDDSEGLSREMEDIFLKGIRSLLTTYMQKELQPAIKETLMRNMGYTISYG